MRLQRRSRSGRERCVLFVAWDAAGRRADDVADLLGGQALSIRPAMLERPWLTPIRWLVSAVATTAGVVSQRPSVVIVTNPPIWAGLSAYAGARLVGAGFVLDSHPGGFGAMNDRVGARVQRLHAWLARRATAVLVTTQQWIDVVESWGGRGAVLHEAPTPTLQAASVPAGDPAAVLAVNTFGRDEPVQPLIEAARAVPTARLDVTGDVSLAPDGLVQRAPSNVRFVGYLSQREYEQAMTTNAACVVLTDEPTSVPRSACEAVWARRPLIITDSPATAEYFPYALRVPSTADGVASGLRRVVEDRHGVAELAQAAADDQRARWDKQLDELRAIVDEAADTGTRNR